MTNNARVLLCIALGYPKNPIFIFMKDLSSHYNFFMFVNHGGTIYEINHSSLKEVVTQ